MPLAEVRRKVCVSEEEGEKCIKRVNRKLTKFYKKTDKVFAKWRKENTSSCKELSQRTGKDTKDVSAPILFYGKEDQFPINTVVSITGL